jgi:thiol-disulfide isomerase/thioredoxin
MKPLLVNTLVALVICSGAAAQAPAVGPTTLEGQIVCCKDCWGRADRTKVAYGTAQDLTQAAQCVAKGDPTLLAVMDSGGATTFYQLEAGRFKRPGRNWLELVGKRVAITGVARSKKDANYIKIDELNILSSSTPAADPPQADAIGSDAELVLKDLFGTEQRLSSLRGRIVVVNFWATYCIPCLKEIPDFAAIQNQYAALGVQVVGATADTLESRAKVLQFIKDAKVNFPVWLGATTGDMGRFGLGPALPGTAIIGLDGKIVATSPGAINFAELKKRIDGLLANADKEAKQQASVVKEERGKASSVPS